MVAETKRANSPVSGRPLCERRRSNRLPAEVAATLTPSGKSAGVHHILVSDLSIHGVGFKAARFLRVGKKLQLDMGNGPLKLCGTVRIISCRPRSDGTYDVGAEFV